MTRKVVQISTAFDAGDGSYQPAPVVIALCDDDSMWHYELRMSGGWQQLPPIPQDAAPEPATVRAGPVTDEEVQQAILTWTAVPGDMTEWWTAVLTDFLARRGISTEPAEFTDEQVDAAVHLWFRTRDNGDHPRERMRAALRAAGARP